MAINAGCLRDPQLCDDEAYDKDAYLEKLNEIKEAIDEVALELYMLLSEHENKNVRNAYGVLNRAMAYIDDEL